MAIRTLNSIVLVLAGTACWLPSAGRAVAPTEFEPAEAARFKVYGLEPGARNVVNEVDSGEARTLSGRELTKKGLLVLVENQPGDALLKYARLQ